MKTTALKLFVTFTLLALVVASCVSISGQRVSWYHDQAKDTLRLLIHYDGIHEGKGRSTKGADQIPEFVKNGDILLIDWWGHLEMGPLREKLRTGNLLEKMVAKTLTSFQVQVAGHYVDPGGRIGALQLVTVPKVSRFVKQLNELINAAVIAGLLGDKSLPKTTAWQKEAARDRHEWVALDGHAIRVRIPLHPDEAARAKGQFLSTLVSRALGKEGDEHKHLVRRVARQIAEAPISVIQEEEELTLVFGYRKRTCTIRLTCRDEYNPKLEEAVKKNAPGDLDRAFAAALIRRTEASKQGEPEPLPGVLGELHRWGPAEERVRALLALVKSEEPLPQRTAAATRNQAIRALEAFASSWNERGMLPKAPVEDADADAYFAAWGGWYTAVTGRAPIPD